MRLDPPRGEFDGNQRPFLNFDRLVALFEAAGCNRLVAKWLAPNDNSKNQIYFGPDFQAVNLLPHGKVITDDGRFKAPLDLDWVDETGTSSNAPWAQLILYPQYPEVRFSGFLRGSPGAPSELLASREKGRLMLLGFGEGSKILGHVASADSPIARELEVLTETGRGVSVGVFLELPMGREKGDPTEKLLRALRGVHEAGWVSGQRLRADGVVTQTNAPNACGYTLESLLGISANSAADPDFAGWELKSLTVRTLGVYPASHRMTLMTPEPKGGFYRERGVLDFVRRYGYRDRNGIEDRLNFGGQFRVGSREKTTGLAMNLLGYSALPGEVTGRIDDPNGGVALLDDAGEVAALWPYADLIEHWNRKHALAAYVPAVSRTESGVRQYRFDRIVFLGIQTYFLRFLGSMNLGRVVYDPGIKVERNSSPSPVTKRRSQFRTRFSDLELLYARFGARQVS